MPEYPKCTTCGASLVQVFVCVHPVYMGDGPSLSGNWWTCPACPPSKTTVAKGT